MDGLASDEAGRWTVDHDGETGRRGDGEWTTDGGRRTTRARLTRRPLRGHPTPRGEGISPSPHLPVSSSWSVVLTVILLATLVVNIPTWSQPFGRDQGIFAYIGDGIRHGFVPYRDAWDHKPPGIDFAYAAAFATLGRSMVSVHVLETVSILLTVLLLAALGRRLFGAGVGLAAAALYGLGSTLQFEWWDRVQAETFMALPLTASAYAAVRRAHGGRRAWAFLAGLATGAALLYKPTGGTLVLFALVAFALAGPWAKPGRFAPGALPGLVADLARFGLGLAAGLVPVLAYFAANGALRDLWDTVIVFNQTHVQTGTSLSLESVLRATWDFGARMGPLGLLGALGLWRAVALVRRGALWGGPNSEARSQGGEAVSIWRARSATLAVIWLFACLLGVWVQGKFFSYHWSVAVPALALLAALGLEWLWADWRTADDGPHPPAPSPNPGRGGERASPLPAGEGMDEGVPRPPPPHTPRPTLPRPVARVGVYALLAFVYLVVFVQEQRAGKMGRDLAYLFGRMDQAAYLAQFGHNLRGTDVYAFTEARDTAAYLAAHTAPEDRVLVWGFQALVNFLADRRAPTRFVFNYPLTVQTEEGAEGPPVYREEARARFLAELTARPPRYIVLVRNDVNPLQTVDSQTLLASFPEFRALVERDYAPETDIGNFQLWRRKP